MERKKGKGGVFCASLTRTAKVASVNAKITYTHTHSPSHTHTHRGAREREENPVKSKAN